MSKTKEELNTIKEEVETLNEKLAELTPEEIAQVTGGVGSGAAGKHVSALPYVIVTAGCEADGYR